MSCISQVRRRCERRSVRSIRPQSCWAERVRQEPTVVKTLLIQFCVHQPQFSRNSHEVSNQYSELHPSNGSGASMFRHERPLSLSMNQSNSISSYSFILIFPPWTQLSAALISALCYFPAVCKWHWLADVNSHFTEEISQSLCVPSSDGPSITKATNTHYTPITDHHSSNCNNLAERRRI